MKYLMLDTNIYIDMLVYREKANKSDSYTDFLKLLEYGQIKLLVPSIIKTEIYNHIDTEISKIGSSVKGLKGSASSLYWINHADELEIFYDKMSYVKKGINELNEVFLVNKDK